MNILKQKRVGGRSRRCIRALLTVVTLGIGMMSAGFVTADKLNDGDWYRHRDKGGVLYVMDNSVEGNHIHVYSRRPNGKLKPVPRAATATGGIGASDNAAIDPLGSQNALLFDDKSRMLFAVNAGDNTIAAFRTAFGGFHLRQTALVPSGGFIPVSVAVSEDRLYVLNAGGSGAITTFAIGQYGDLSQLGTLDLGQSNASTIPFNNVMAPGQLGVDALHRRIIVANASGQQLLTAALDDDGVATGGLTATPTPGVVPFAFDISRYGNVLVAEAGSGSVSAFSPSAIGQPLVLTGNVANGQAATCWIVVTDDGYAYVANTGSDTISAYSHSRTGQLTLIDAVAAEASDAPIDMTLAGNGRFLYSLDAGSGVISGFGINREDGSLYAVESQPGLPQAAGIQGIAAFDY